MRFAFRTASLALAMAGFCLAGAARADWVPPFKGNDTGGIIAWPLAMQTNARALADAHCASYGKIARFKAAQRVYGGYVSFACVWVPPRPVYSHHAYPQRVLRVRY